MHRLGIILSSTIFFILLTSLSLADFLGKVVSVLDGETIEVLNNHHPERIRLSGIDCPEKRQAYGQNNLALQWQSYWHYFIQKL